MTVCHFLDRDQFRAAEARRVALAESRRNDAAWMAANSTTYGWASLREVVEPCAMWFCEWWYDPSDPQDATKRSLMMEKIAANPSVKHGYLANKYWLQWSDKRPPIAVLCPNGAEWVVDANSSNSDGWTVIGDPPLITCSPSILVPGYHGFLQNGVFTPNQ
jgi:hypothetical protein